VKRPKKRGAGLAATEPQIKKLTGKNYGLSDSNYQAFQYDGYSYHPIVKEWGKLNWLTEEFEEHLSKSTEPRKRGDER
jgi:hypothetical protein